MDLSFDVSIPFPPEVVFRAYRDDIRNLVPFLPNVRSIELSSRKEDGPRCETVMVWNGGGDIPAALRAVLSDSMLSWTDYATWDASTLRCDWRTQTHAMTEAVHCQGFDLFLDGGHGDTKLQMRGKFEIDAKQIRGVPGFLAGKVSRGIEEFLGGKIGANLAETARALTKYLEQRKQ